MEIAIVTDSTADIPDDLTQENQIHVVPNLVIIDGKPYQDGIELSRQEYYELLPFISTPPTTATASVGTYQNLYEKLIGLGAKHILSIHVSSLLSGVINAASTAAQEFGKSVHVFDSRNVTLGLGFQVLAAAEAVRNGASLETVLEVLMDIRSRARVIAMLDTLEYVRRSGRVSWARARLGNLLRLKPFVDVHEGHVLSLGEARTRRKGIERLRELLIRLGSLERLAILHTNAEDDASQFLRDLNPNLLTTPLIVNVTTAIGTHVGPNGLGFAAIVKKENIHETVLK